jgi:hypothetical protein
LRVVIAHLSGLELAVVLQSSVKPQSMSPGLEIHAQSSVNAGAERLVQIFLGFLNHFSPIFQL